MPPSPIDSQIRARVEQFTEELAGVIRQTALEAVGAAWEHGLPTLREVRRRLRRPHLARIRSDPREPGRLS